jgi:sugar-specific transcriptional regulator TrmB
MDTQSRATQIIQELRKIDLSEKEARCYMTLLKYGPSGVQKISRTLRLTRPTAYRLLETLDEKGLIKEITLPGKKVRGYSAKSPDELIGLLRMKRRKIEEQERELLRVISELRNEYYGDENEIVTYGTTPEAIKTCVSDMALMNISELYVLHSAHSDDNPITEKGLEEIYVGIRSSRGKIPIHEISSSTKEHKTLSFDGTMIIADKVYIFTKREITIINKSIVKTLLTLFISYIGNEKP